jgi:hypothetical protein
MLPGNGIIRVTDGDRLLFYTHLGKQKKVTFARPARHKSTVL